MRYLVSAALIGLMATPAFSQEFSPKEQIEIDQRVRAYILQNPEIIVEAMQVLEARRERDERAADGAMVSRLGDEIVDDGYSFVAGNPDGDVTVVEFSDYRCGYCKQAHEGVKALVENDANVRLVIKEFPILGPESTFAARAAMAALRQGGDKYVALNDAMMTWRGDLSEGAVMSQAAEAGLVRELVSGRDALIERAKQIVMTEHARPGDEPLAISNMDNPGEARDGLDRIKGQLSDTASARAVVECVEAGLNDGWEASLACERSNLIRLRSSDEGKAAIESFFARSK